MNIRDFLQDNIVVMDGGMGTLLQQRGLLPGEYPERWNMTHASEVQDIHRAYFDAGSHIVNANTFGANCLKFAPDELATVIRSAVENARLARESSSGIQPKFIALDIGPTGRMLKPFGDFDFEEAVEVFAQTVRLGVACGVDLIFIETMSDSYETKAAVLAAKENSDLPVFVSNAYGGDGKLMTGASPAAMVAMLEGLRVDAIGANCSLGPQQLGAVVEELLHYASVPVILKPNAGLPQVRNGRTEYDVDADSFGDAILSSVAAGVRIVGGCCGTTPAYIQAVSDRISGVKPVALTDKPITFVSSYTHAVTFDKQPVLIGERINPTGKKRFKQALVEKDMEYILGEGIAQQEKGVHVLDVNVGLPEIDECRMLCDAVCELQAVIDLPLQIDTADGAAMEAALRAYNGKAMVNSVNGKEESMHTVFPLVKKYGGLVVALTLDEEGIPSTVDGRFRIAEKILRTAEAYGIAKKDLIFDPLAMTVSADTDSALVTLGALRRIRQELGCHTSLGVSNISFGLPNRDTINSTFFALALENGLSAAIMNPYSAAMMTTYYAYRALHGLDENCGDYIAFAASVVPTQAVQATAVATVQSPEENAGLQRAIAKGMKEQAAALTQELLQTKEPLSIVQNEIIPALDTVGTGFEQKRVFLPQLLMSAEAAKAAFERIRCHMVSVGGPTADKGQIVLATVKGDIHDIGKNIVKLLLENYGFAVTDLGRDVPPEAVLTAVQEKNAPVVGLSALMTTTVPAMEKTIALLHEQAPACKIVVGGAVLTADYAAKIGADKYAGDAMETVRYAETICENKSR